MVEIDETYVGGKANNAHNAARPPRGAQAPCCRWSSARAQVRSQHVASVNGKTLGPVIAAQVDKASYIMTDESTVYPPIAKDFAGHGTVNHSPKEYVRAHSGIRIGRKLFLDPQARDHGHVSSRSEAHLHRYLAEFDFRYNQRSALGVDDTERMERSQGDQRQAPYLSAD